MKREIKFRAWDSKKQNWIKDFTLYPDGKLVGINHAYGNIHLMQFTGAYDLLGNEIYEGDIVSFDRGDLMGKVVWIKDKYNAGFFISSRPKPKHAISLYAISWTEKIIGNIYENPELLK